MAGTFPIGSPKRKQQAEAAAESQLRELALKLDVGHLLRSPAELAEIREAARPKRPFVVGDVVKLKSGGHRMTVTELECRDTVTLHYSHAGDVVHAHFSEHCLRLCEVGEGDDPLDIPF